MGRGLKWSRGQTCGTGGLGGPCLLGDEIDDLGHDPVDLEVLGRIDARDAGLDQLRRVGSGDDAADHDRRIHVALAQHADGVRDQLHVRA